MAPTVTLAGKQVGKVGLGLMQLTWTPSPVPDEQAFAAIKAATDAGATAWSSATFYGNPPGGQLDNLKLIRRFFDKYPEYKDKVVVVIKGGLAPSFAPTTDIATIRAELATVASILGDKPIDVYSPARLDPHADPVPFFAELAKLRDEGLFSAVGASEVSAKTLRKISEVIKPAVLEIEVSLWSYEQPIQDALAWAAETATPVFAYSPLGRGFLTRKWKSPADIPDGSFQKLIPRFQGEAFYDNLKLVDRLDEIAAQKGITTAQLAIAWVASLNPYTIPIPGTSDPERAVQNTEAGAIELSADDHKTIGAILDGFDLSGGRYPAMLESHLMV
ncbi:hypothetical protein Q5752_003284 [Cryptotrichosporon argae]